MAGGEGSPTPNLATATVTPCEILKFADRGTAASDDQRLRAALDRVQSIHHSNFDPAGKCPRQHRFSWVNEWQERAIDERPQGLELILPAWLYEGVFGAGQDLTIDRRYSRLTGGLERWLYRLVRKHAGRQATAWRFDCRHLYAKSGALIRFSDFAIHLRRIAIRQALPGYQLTVERRAAGPEMLRFSPATELTIRQRISLLSRKLSAEDKP